MRLLIIVFLCIAAKPVEPNCQLAIDHYLELGERFATFLLKETKESDPQYDERFSYYLEEITRYSRSYCECKKRLGLGIVDLSSSQK